MSMGTVLIVEDDTSLREGLCETLQLAEFDVLTAQHGEEGIECLQKHDNISLVLSDVQMSPMDGIAFLRHVRKTHVKLPVVLMTAYGTIESAVQAMHIGATDYLVKPFEAQSLIDVVTHNITSNAYVDDDDASGMITIDPRSQQMAEVARRVASTEVTVMISGESGVGKEVISRFIHDHSPRKQGPFVAINCAAIPENMLESVLFGYEKGAFTGAHQSKEGKFEQAQGGTLLLDEITEMDLGLQAKLLRVLQEREVERLGGRKVIPLDVRILATTNRDIRQVVAEGKFREDLFYRLNVFPLNLLPLRERREDIVPMARKMLAKYTDGMSTPALTSAAMSTLQTHHWPGNVRELDNVVQRALIMRCGDVIDADDIQFEQLDKAPAIMAPQPAPKTVMQAEPYSDGCLNKDMKAHERELIISALRAKNSRKEVAEKLGISPRTLRYKLAKLRDAGVALPA